MSEQIETKKVKVQKRKAYFARYINKYGRRHQVNKSMSDGILRNFVDGVWVEIPEADIRKIKADAEVNPTWEYEEREVVLEATHHYARFMGLQGKKAAKMVQYDRDQYGNIIESTKREYFMPKKVWIMISEKDIPIFERKAKGNAHFEYVNIKLPTTINPPLKIEGQSPEAYRLEVLQEIREAEEEQELETEFVNEEGEVIETSEEPEPEPEEDNSSEEESEEDDN